MSWFKRKMIEKQAYVEETIEVPSIEEIQKEFKSIKSKAEIEGYMTSTPMFYRCGDCNNVLGTIYDRDKTGELIDATCPFCGETVDCLSVRPSWDVEGKYHGAIERLYNLQTNKDAGFKLFSKKFQKLLDNEFGFLSEIQMASRFG